MLRFHQPLLVEKLNAAGYPQVKMIRIKGGKIGSGRAIRVSDGVLRIIIPGEKSAVAAAPDQRLPRYVLLKRGDFIQQVFRPPRQRYLISR